MVGMSGKTLRTLPKNNPPEAEIDAYFNTFEGLAIAVKWPDKMWPLLLQCKIHGKTQDVVSALPLADSLRYETVNDAILQASELVPEAYRQKFREQISIEISHQKASTQTFVEFAWGKGALFDCWCLQSNRLRRVKGINLN